MQNFIRWPALPGRSWPPPCTPRWPRPPPPPPAPPPPWSSRWSPPPTLSPSPTSPSCRSKAQSFHQTTIPTSAGEQNFKKLEKWPKLYFFGRTIPSSYSYLHSNVLKALEALPWNRVAFPVTWILDAVERSCSFWNGVEKLCNALGKVAKQFKNFSNPFSTIKAVCDLTQMGSCIWSNKKSILSLASSFPFSRTALVGISCLIFVTTATTVEEKMKFWPYLDYLVANLRTFFGALLTGLNSAAAHKNWQISGMVLFPFWFGKCSFVWCT